MRCQRSKFVLLFYSFLQSIEHEARIKAAKELNPDEDIEMDFDPVPEIKRSHF